MIPSPFRSPLVPIVRTQTWRVTVGLAGLLVLWAATPAQAQRLFPIQIERGRDGGADFGPSGGPLLEQLEPVINNGTAGPDRDRADQLLRQGDTHYRKGSYLKAIEAWETALEQYQSVGDDEGVGITLDLIGLTQGDRGDYLAAEQALRRRLSVARLRKDFQGQMYTLNNLGMVLIQGGTQEHLNVAEEAFEEAYAIAKDIDHLDGQGLSLSNLGLVSAGRGDYAQAVKRHEEALLFRQRGDNPAGEINTLNHLGTAYWALGFYDEAIGAYGAALNLAEALEEPYAKLRAMAGLAEAHLTVGRLERAMDLMTERLALAQELGDVYQQFLSVQEFFEFYHDRGDLAVARTYLLRLIGYTQLLGEEYKEKMYGEELRKLDTLLATEGS